MERVSCSNEYLLALLAEVYALLEVAVELNTLSSSARAAYLSEDALAWCGADSAGPADADTAVLKPLPCSLLPREKSQGKSNQDGFTFCPNNAEN